MKLFTYGSILLPSMTKKQFKHVFTPYKSVFIRRYKLVLQHANSKTYPRYHYILCEYTGKDEDMIPGFLVNIPEFIVEALDQWEGSSYKRESIECFTRDLDRVGCNIYVKK